MIIFYRDLYFAKKRITLTLNIEHVGRINKYTFPGSQYIRTSKPGKQLATHHHLTEKPTPREEAPRFPEYLQSPRLQPGGRENKRNHLTFPFPPKCLYWRIKLSHPRAFSSWRLFRLEVQWVVWRMVQPGRFTRFITKHKRTNERSAERVTFASWVSVERTRAILLRKGLLAWSRYSLSEPRGHSIRRNRCSFSRSHTALSFFTLRDCLTGGLTVVITGCWMLEELGAAIHVFLPGDHFPGSCAARGVGGTMRNFVDLIELQFQFAF